MYRVLRIIYDISSCVCVCVMMREKGEERWWCGKVFSIYDYHHTSTLSLCVCVMKKKKK